MSGMLHHQIRDARFRAYVMVNLVTGRIRLASPLGGPIETLLPFTIHLELAI